MFSTEGAHAREEVEAAASILTGSAGLTAANPQQHINTTSEALSHRSATLPLRVPSISARVTALSRCVSMLQVGPSPSMAYAASSCICTSSPRSWACAWVVAAQHSIAQHG